MPRDLLKAASYLAWLTSSAPSDSVKVAAASYADPAVGPEEEQMVGGFSAPKAEVLQAITAMIENELKTGYAYQAYAQALRGVSRDGMAEEFTEHAGEETEHAEYLMRRASVLGGPLQLPDIPAPPAATDPVDIARIMLRIEQEGAAKWRLLHSLINDDNPMRFKVEEYMTREESHQDDLKRYLPEEETVDLGTLAGPTAGALSAANAPPAPLPSPPPGAEPKMASLRDYKRAAFDAPPMIVPPAQESTLGMAAQQPVLGNMAPPPGTEEEAAQQQQSNEAAFYRTKNQESQQMLEQLQGQLQEAQGKQQQLEQDLQQQQQLGQQQQNALRQQQQVATEAMSEQVRSAAAVTASRKQVTDTVSQMEAWKQQVRDAVDNPPAPNPQGGAAPPDTPAEASPEANPQEQGPPTQMPQGGDGLDGKTAGVKQAGPQFDQFRDLLRQMQDGEPKQSLLPVVTSLAGAAVGAARGYMNRGPEHTAKAKASLEKAEADMAASPGFGATLRSLNAKRNLALAEASERSPALAMLHGALSGAEAGGLIGGGIEGAKAIKDNIQAIRALRKV